MFSVHLKNILRLRWCLIALLCLICFSSKAGASDVSLFGIEECFQFSSERYGINSNLLKAIAITESNMDPNAVNLKSNDYGLMQINEFWLPILAKYGIYKSDLFDPCTSIITGAWILADSIARYGETWEAVGAYNAGTGNSAQVKQQREHYSGKVYRNYLSLLK
jgi:soluble lytic murein transglycosylase-like protein